MTTNYGIEQTRETVIATFGTANLVHSLNGRFELRGGSANELADAREWVSMFMPEATIPDPIFKKARC